MTDWNASFDANGYEPLNRPDIARCPLHPGHAMLPYPDGSTRCTSSGHLPKVRDDVDRIGEALAKAGEE